MPDKKISELGAASALDGTELVPVVQGAITKRTTAQAIADLGGGGNEFDFIEVGHTDGDPAVVPVTVQGADGQTADLVKVRAGAMPAYLDAFFDLGGGEDNSNVLFTAQANGTSGNAITMEYIDSGVPLTPLSVAVVGTAITVTLEANGGGGAISTADDVIAAVNGDVAAHALVEATVGEGSDGSGLIVITFMATNLSRGAAAQDAFVIQPRGQVDLSAPFTLRGVDGQTAHVFRAYDHDGVLSVDIDFEGVLDTKHIVVQVPPDTGDGDTGHIVLSGANGKVTITPKAGQSALTAGDPSFVNINRTGMGPDNGYLELTQRNNADTLVVVVMGAAPSSDLLQIWDNAFNEKMFRLDKNAGIVFRQHSAPADGDLTAGDCALWFDQTDGAAKLMIKAKSEDGTVVAGAVNLA